MDFFKGGVSLLRGRQIRVVLGLCALFPWVELLGWMWKLTGTSLDLHEDSVVMLLFLLTLGA